MRFLLERPGDDSQRPTLITLRGIGTYLTCHRAWWLAEVLAYAPDDESRQARQLLTRRKYLAQRLAAAGSVMIATAIIIMVLGLLLGSG
jgi:hypothetical protein